MNGRVKLMEHQKKAIWALKSGSILCAGVGTGKSITALAYYYICVCKGGIWGDGKLGVMSDPRDLYIITTARKRDTKEWDEECKRFALGEHKDVKVVIDSWNNLHKYEGVKGAFFIFDEQRVVGSGAWVKSFYKVAAMNQWILLTATPGDSWLDYIPVFVANGFYKNRTQFLRRHAVYSRYSQFPKIDKWLETAYLESLRRRITVVMRFDKKTEQHWERLTLPYNAEEYKRVAVDRWDIVKNEPIKDISRACHLMRQVCNSGSERMDAVLELVEKHRKVIIFYNYDYELESLREGLKKASVTFAEWNGHRHEAIPKTEKWCYLVQYLAGAEGWNCVETDAIIFYSQNYSYKIMTQAAGRIDRMNTRFTDLYYYLIRTDSPIDRAIAKALQGKKKFNEKNYLKGWNLEGSDKG